MVRKAAVSGQFYPGDMKLLSRELDDLIVRSDKKINAIGAVSPHAGYIYSGAVAGKVYGKLEKKDTYVILGPNHTGGGGTFSLSIEPWITPLGTVAIDVDLCKSIQNKTPLLKNDASSHMFEHSIEVQLPFIQKTAPDAKIVPITVKYGSINELREIGKAISDSIIENDISATIIASSDMTHCESRENAGKKDKKAINEILKLDPEGLLTVVSEERISMCGCVPAAIMLYAANNLKASMAELVQYSDSGDFSGDISQVVGYAGIVVF